MSIFLVLVLSFAFCLAMGSIVLGQMSAYLLNDSLVCVRLFNWIPVSLPHCLPINPIVSRARSPNGGMYPSPHPITGLLVSALCHEENTAVMMILGTFYPNLILSGKSSLAQSPHADMINLSNQSFAHATDRLILISL